MAALGAPIGPHPHVLSVDLKGFGRSDKPVDDAYGVLAQALLLETLIKRRGLRHLTIVGHSLGGGVALALTVHLNLTQPETVARLVLLDSIAYRQPVPLFIELLRTPVLADVGLLATPPELEVYKGLVAAYADPQKITLEAVSAYARPLYDPGGRQALVKTAQGIIPTNLSSLIAGYRTIQQPTLLIWCRADRVVPLWVGRRLARALPNAQLSLLKGCGHIPQEEEPAATLRLIKTFLFWTRTPRRAARGLEAPSALAFASPTILAWPAPQRSSVDAAECRLYPAGCRARGRSCLDAVADRRRRTAHARSRRRRGRSRHQHRALCTQQPLLPHTHAGGEEFLVLEGIFGRARGLPGRRLHPQPAHLPP